MCPYLRLFSGDFSYFFVGRFFISFVFKFSTDLFSFSMDYVCFQDLTIFRTVRCQ